MYPATPNNEINTFFSALTGELNIIVLGTCAMQPLIDQAALNNIRSDHHLLESHSHSALPELKEGNNYDAIILGLTLRHILEEAGSQTVRGIYDDLYWAKLNDEMQAEDYFKICQELIFRKIDQLIYLSERAPLFILGFLQPKHNLRGNLAKRVTYLNPRYFVSRLNDEISQYLETKKNAYFVDNNEITSMFGSLFLQDDYTSHAAHASFITDWNNSYDSHRIQTSTSATQMYNSSELYKQYADYLWSLIRNNIEIISQKKPIKLIIIDLDDTLWRGIVAEGQFDQEEFVYTEGWPVALAEALLFYKSRGGLLAICSKNDHEVTIKNFERLWRNRISLDDFVSIKINYERKSQNIREILEETNLLAQNVLFIDDNPREIDEVKNEISDINILNLEHYDWRRFILYSPRTQVVNLTNESNNRTESIKAKIHRDTLAKSMSREKWLHSLGLKQEIFYLNDPQDKNFDRAFELLNKTNQFNTNGKRWTLEELIHLFRDGGYLVAMTLADKTANNGLTGLAVIHKNKILQQVLSCRVFNLGAENSLGAHLVESILKTYPAVEAEIVDTGRNFSCHNYYRDLGFQEVGENNFICKETPPLPSHISVSIRD